MSETNGTIREKRAVQKPGATVFIVLPPNYLEISKRQFRLLVATILKNTQKPDAAVASSRRRRLPKRAVRGKDSRPSPFQIPGNEVTTR